MVFFVAKLDIESANCTKERKSFVVYGLTQLSNIDVNIVYISNRPFQTAIYIWIS